jgi:chromosomal replication initiation ATPase DnaA
VPDGISRVPLDSPWTPTPTVTIPPLRAILEIVCAELGVTVADVFTDDPRPRVEAARRVTAWLAYSHPYDTPEIGRLLGREPATVAAMVARHDLMVEKRPAVADRMIGLAAALARTGP